MKSYRFSPITSLEKLHEAIHHIHIESYKLCMDSFGAYFENAGNIGIFCHYDEEFQFLKGLQAGMVHPSDNPLQKYYELIKPIVIEGEGSIPKTSYTHLYIRKPDPYRHHVGDLDFYLSVDIYRNLQHALFEGENIPGARIFDRPDLDMIELFNPDCDVLAYISTRKMSEEVRVKLSEHTKL